MYIILSDDKDKIFSYSHIIRDSLIITASEKLYKELIPSLNITLINATHLADVSREEAMQVCNNINRVISEVVSDTMLKMIWETAFNYSDGIGDIGRDLLGICRACGGIFYNNSIDRVFIIPEEHNKMLCQVIIEISKKYGIPWTLIDKRVKSLYKNCLFLRKIFYIIVNTKLFLSIINLKKNKSRQKYMFGYSLCSNAKRIVNWTSDAAEKFSKIFSSYRILCMDCKEGAAELIARGFCVDVMEEWFSFTVFIRKVMEYRKFRKKIYYKFKSNFEFYFDDIDLTDILLKYVERYLYQEVALYYKWNIICASYFKYNEYEFIEPYCVSSYPQTRIFYVNVEREMTQFCRTDSADLFWGSYDAYYEKYPDIFSVRFTSNLGVDYMAALRKLGWNGICYNIGGGGYQDKWLKTYQRDISAVQSKKELGTILLAPTGPTGNLLTTQEISRKIDSLLDRIRGLNLYIICKFHPNMLMDNEIVCLINKYEKYKNIFFPESYDAVDPYLDKADLVITDISLVTFDTIAARKPLVLYCPGDEYNLVSYLDNHICIVRKAEEIKTLFLELLQNNSYYCVWRDKMIKQQDDLLNSKQDACNDPYKKIKELIEDQKYKDMNK